VRSTTNEPGMGLTGGNQLRIRDRDLSSEDDEMVPSGLRRAGVMVLRTPQYQELRLQKPLQSCEYSTGTLLRRK